MAVGKSGSLGEVDAVPDFTLPSSDYKTVSDFAVTGPKSPGHPGCSRSRVTTIGNTMSVIYDESGPARSRRWLRRSRLWD